jgi:hypothetical protein
MALDLKFKISETDTCDQVQICDITADFIPNSPAESCNGYAVLDDGAMNTILRSDVVSSKINVIFPDGTKFTGFDVGLLPAQHATGNFTLAAGAVGDALIVDIDGVYLGQATYIASLADTIVNLVNSINLNTAVTGWMAYYEDETVYLLATSSDTAYNDLAINVYQTSGGSFTVTINTTVTAGGNDGDGCVTITLPDLYGQTVCPPGYPCWPIGVYTWTYIIYDTDGKELSRSQQKVLFDCQVVKCICAQVQRLLECTSCDGKEAAAKVRNLQILLDAVYEEFNTGNYDCANEHIQDLFKKCKSLCVDC